MEPLQSNKIIRLYECLLEVCDILYLPIEDITKVFYCGINSKWGIPNTLLVVIKDQPDSLYHDEMTKIGCTGGAYLNKYTENNPCSGWDALNRPYQYSYSVIAESTFDTFEFMDLVPATWNYPNNQYRFGLSILDEMKRLDELVVFI